MSAHLSPFQIRFPRVLDRLDYDRSVTRRAVVLDGKEAIEWYVGWATDGVEYERTVQSAENRGHPHSLTETNVSNLWNVRGRGWSRETLAPLLNRPLPELESIPVDASLFGTKEYDRPAIALINRFCQIPGVKLANATKLLYQKRPGLIPIIDEFARRVYDLPWLDGPDDNDFSQVLRMAYWNLREFNQVNLHALNELEGWLVENPDVTGGLHLTRLRIIDILAWGAVKRAELAS